MNPAADTLLDHASVEVKRRWVHELRWKLSRHTFQVPPAGDWLGWMLQAGRGAGKTRTGAEDAVEACLTAPGYRYAVVAPTFGDARDICIEGDSGVLFVLTGMGLAVHRDYEWNRSLGELIFSNRSTVKCYSAEKPEHLRGPQHHRAWCEELASWKDANRGDVWNTTFNNLMLGLRLGAHPRYIVTTTPRRVRLVQELVDKPEVVITRGTTHDNLANLAPTFADQILQYEGTAIGRQEILGELLSEVEGALWTLLLIEKARRDSAPDFDRVVVGVDPQGSASGMTGIVVAGRSPRCDDGANHASVLADYSISGSPRQWADRVVSAYHTFEADRIVVEKNFGGDMVESTIRTVWPEAPIKTVTASRGKAIRAEPIAALYEQGRVHHVGQLSALEDEMTTWTAEDGWSPNRLDALVWALTDLGLGKQVTTTSSLGRIATARI